MALVASVVVATHNRRERVHRLLDGLAIQTGAPPFEVVVVDDGSSDGTFESLRERQGDPFEVIPLRLEPNRGPAAARNVGWRAARADLVCFTDDDCLPDPGWLAALTNAVVGIDIAQGRTVPDEAQAGNHGPFSRTMVVPYEEGFYETCNIVYRRTVLENLGGFDESFRFPYGEDTDLAWRAREAGAQTAFAHDALVRHDVWPSDFRAHLRDMRRREGLVLAFRKHPQLRGYLGRGIFFRQVHPPTVSALAALALLANKPRSKARLTATTASVLWYAWVCHLVRHKPRRRWQWTLVVPLAFLADTYEVAVMARASAKYRTLLL
jgi:GT2 family glycosyltransferase